MIEASVWGAVGVLIPWGGSVLEIKSVRLKLVIMGHILPFYPPIIKTKQNQNFEKMKRSAGDTIILHMCSKNHNHMRYGSPDTDETKNLENNLENKKSEKNEKDIYRCLHFTHVYQKSRSYVCFLK